MYDVVIIGGGPAGLSAALVLGRCRRRVLVCDDGHPRNARAREVHGYLTRDGTPPLELLRLGREELTPYGIEWLSATAQHIEGSHGQFQVRLATGDNVSAAAVLIATGVRDHVPEIPGLSDCYGITVHHCPFCDGWEARDRVLAALGDTVSPAGLALSLRTWSDRVIACTNGRARVGRTQRARLEARGITLYESPIARIESEGGRVQRIAFADGSAAECEVIFFTAAQSQQCELARRLGCEFTRRGTVRTDRLGHTCVPGIYVVGDASRDVQFVIVAAAEGAKAAVAIHQALQERVLPGAQLAASS